MNADQIRRIMDKGFSVVIENTLTGVKERYTPTSTGMYAKTYHGHNTCMHCGKPLSVNCRPAPEHMQRCSCQERLKIVSMTGAYRRIVELAACKSEEMTNPRSRCLTLTVAS